MRASSKTLVSLAEEKLDKLDNIYLALKNIDERQKRDWQLHLRSKRRQVYIGLFMAFLGGASFYFDIIRFDDFGPVKDRFESVYNKHFAETTINEIGEELPKQMLAMEKTK